MLKKIRNIIIGKPRDINDPGVFHHVSLVAFLAWVGLGADGLSSSAYGPDEAYRALLHDNHGHLALLLVGMTALTVGVISFAYSNLIEKFPGGGGGYLVATKLLGEKAGVVSGCALLVDYVLTIAVSIASATDQLWSFLPAAWLVYKLPAAIAILVVLVILNLRGVKESVTILTPIFLVFLATHLFMILYAVISHLPRMPVIFGEAAGEFRGSVGMLGYFPVFMILMRAYSMGGGTYTGIEAVSNGVGILREPRVKTAKKTMFLMAVSLAFTAGGILFGYLLTDARPEAGKTLNAVLLQNLYSTWTVGGVAVGSGLIILTLAASAMLLIVAAQTGFLDGPRVLSNMAVDSWMPHRFAQLSDRLVTKNGVYLMGAAAIALLLYTRGNITMLVTMYAINVFITFSLTELGMTKYCMGIGFDYWRARRAFAASGGKTPPVERPHWKRDLAVHATGLTLCLSILVITIHEKFFDGGWMTVVITGTVVLFCFLIRSHYHEVNKGLKRLDDILVDTPFPESAKGVSAPLDKRAPTAVITVSGFSGYGLHQLLSVEKLFPRHFKNYIFVSVGVVDSGNFKGDEELDRLESETRGNLEKYVEWCRRQGLRAEYRMVIATEAVQSVEEMCHALAKEFPRSIFFTGKLIFQEEKWYHRLLHNETALAIQRRLQFGGLQTIVLPIRVL